MSYADLPAPARASGSPPATAVLPRPEVSPPRPWEFPVPTRSTTSNGITVLAYAVPGQHVVSVRFSIPLSLAAEPPELEGVSTIMARLLDEGTAAHTGEEFAELLERKGVAIGVAASEAGVGLDVDVPRRNLEVALDLVRQMVSEPSFPEAEVRRIVTTRLAEIEQERASAPHRAMREFIATFFDPLDRASRPTAGRPETVSAITREAVVAHHARSLGPRGASMTLAGDFGDLDVHGLVEAALGSWANPDHQPPPPPTAPARSGEAARIVVVDRPGSVQSEVVVGAPGPDRHVEGGWSPYPVLAFVVGGSPTARLDAVLREEKGYTYGIRAGFRPRRRGGLFLTTGSVRSDVTAESLGLLLDILATARDGFTEAEVRDGADFVTMTAPGRFATADAVADEGLMLLVDRLPLDFTTATLRAMAALTPTDLSTAYDRVATAGWTVVIVGDAQSWVEQVRALGRGDVTVVPA